MMQPAVTSSLALRMTVVGGTFERVMIMTTKQIALQVATAWERDLKVLKGW